MVAMGHQEPPLDIVAARTKEDPIEVFGRALDNVRPVVEVKSRRVGGAERPRPEQSVTARKREKLLALTENSLALTRSRSGKPTGPPRGLSTRVEAAPTSALNSTSSSSPTPGISSCRKTSSHF